MIVGVKVQYFDGCPGWQVATERVREAADRAGVDVTLVLEQVETIEDATRLGFTGSPTVLVEGRDVCESAGAAPALTCRLYATDDGLTAAPSVAVLERAFAAAAGVVDG